MYDVPHALVSVIGSGSSSLETWSFGLRLVPASVGPQALADQLKPIVAAWFGAAGMAFSSEVKLTEIKVANIEEDGHYPPDGVAASSFVVPPLAGTYAVGGAQQYLLPQSSLAITLTTAKPRGFASKGRIYLPPQGIVLVAGQLQISHAQGFADQVRTLVQNINSAPLAGNVAVMSKGKGEFTVNSAGKKIWTFPHVGTHELVTGVRCGRVIDTQRRRRRSIPEVPVSAAV